MLAWLIALSCLTQQPDAANASSLKIEPPNLELGEVDRGKNLVNNVTITNTSATNIRLMSLDGMTKTVLARVLDGDGNQLLGFDGKGSWNRILLPGKSVTLEVTVVPAQIKGHGLRARLTLFTDEAKATRVPVLIRANLKDVEPRPGEPLAQPSRRLLIEPSRIDFGTLLSGDDARITALLTNAGNNDLEIRKIATSCGCTVPRIVTATESLLASDLDGGHIVKLAPHATAGLEARLISKGLVGEVVKNITITTDDRLISIEVVAHLEKGYSMQPGGLVFGAVQNGAPAHASVTLDVQGLTSLPIRQVPETAAAGSAPGAGATPADGSAAPPGAGAGSPPGSAAPPAAHAPPPFEITQAVSPDPSLTVVVNKIPGEKVAYRIEATLAPDAPASALKAPVILKTTHPLVPEIMIPVVGQKAETVLFNVGDGQSDRLDFGFVKEGEGAERDITIENMDPATSYSISSVDVESRNAAFIKHEVITVEEGRKYRVRLSVGTDMPKGYFTGTLTITSASAKAAKKEVKILGFVGGK